MKKLLLLSIILFIHAGLAYADIRLPKLFSNNMILQREIQVPVWGWADPGEKITVELGGHFAETVTGKSGETGLFLQN